MYAFSLTMNMLDSNETDITNSSLAMFTKLEYVLENRLKGRNQFETSQLIWWLPYVGSCNKFTRDYRMPKTALKGWLFKTLANFWICMVSYLCFMSEDLSIIQGTKEEQYVALLPQVKALISGEPDLVANLANIAAALKEQFGWLWVGFYLVKEDELVLGPFQGPVACTRIRKGRGVCGSSWADAKTLIVADVEKFPGHIACSSLSRSEIVVPIIKDGVVLGVLDADSADLDSYDEIDQRYLEEMVGWIEM